MTEQASEPRLRFELESKTADLMQSEYAYKLRLNLCESVEKLQKYARVRFLCIISADIRVPPKFPNE